MYLEDYCCLRKFRIVKATIDATQSSASSDYQCPDTEHSGRYPTDEPARVLPEAHPYL